MTKLTKRSFLAGGLALLAAPAFAAKEPYWYLERDNFVAQGADVVAYFGLPQNARRAVDGDNAFTTRWNDANWRFSSAEHLDMFKANPNRFDGRTFRTVCTWVPYGNPVFQGMGRTFRTERGLNGFYLSRTEGQFPSPSLMFSSSFLSQPVRTRLE